MRQGTTVNKNTSSFQSECFVTSVTKQEFNLNQKYFWSTVFFHILYFITIEKNKRHKLRIKISNVYHEYAKFLQESRFEVGKEIILCDLVLYMNVIRYESTENVMTGNVAGKHRKRIRKNNR